MRSFVWTVAVVALFATLAQAAQPSVEESRVLITQLAADLAAEPSATAVLQRWCAERGIADPAVMVAERQLGHDKPATAAIRALLHAGADEPIRYRKVALACGKHVLSRADNWYRPGALTPAMNAELAATDHPFGAVVRPLGFHRQSLAAEVLAKPGAAKIPAQIIRNKALLETPDGAPFSLVVETYAKTILEEPSERKPRESHPRSKRPTSVTVIESAPAAPRVRRHHSEHARRARASPHLRTKKAQ